MKLRTLLAAALLAAALVPLNSAAQVPPLPAAGPAATDKLAIVGLAAGPSQLNAGASESLPFTVQLTADGLECTSDSTVTVDLLVTNANAAPPGVTATVDPPNATLKIGMGVYSSTVPPGTPAPVSTLNTTATATLKITASPATAGGSFGPTVGAALKSVTPNGCLNTLPDASDSKTHQVTIASGSSGNTTTPGGTTPPPGGNATGNETQPPAEPPKKSPGLGPLAVVGGLSLLAVLRRRRA